MLTRVFESKTAKENLATKFIVTGEVDGHRVGRVEIGHKTELNKCPEFQKPISTIEGFWDSFKESTIRKAYNFTKHSGKIAYNEIDSIIGNRMNAIVQTETSISHIPIYSEDVGFKKSFREGISELKEFDESILTPYLFTLFNEVAAVLFHAKNNKSNNNHNIC